jgi:hypothetical protein
MAMWMSWTSLGLERRGLPVRRSEHELTVRGKLTGTSVSVNRHRTLSLLVTHYALLYVYSRSDMYMYML